MSTFKNESSLDEAKLAYELHIKGAAYNSKFEKVNSFSSIDKSKSVGHNTVKNLSPGAAFKIKNSITGDTVHLHTNESTLNLIESIVNGATIESSQLFDSLIRARIDEKVATKKKEVASKISSNNVFDKIIKNPKTPIYVLKAAAIHPEIPHHHLNTLINHSDPHVQYAALQNIKLGADPSKEDKEEKAHDKFQKELITHIKSFKGKS